MAAAAAHFNLNQNNDISNNVFGTLSSRARSLAQQTTARQNSSYVSELSDLSTDSISFFPSTSQRSSNAALEQFTYAFSSRYRSSTSLEQHLLQFPNIGDTGYLNNTLPTPPAFQHQLLQPASTSAMVAALSQLQPHYNINSLNFVSANPLSS